MSSHKIQQQQQQYSHTNKMDELFKNLESNNAALVDEAKNELSKAFAQTKENWIVHGMMEYFLSTNSTRIIEILVKVPSPHDIHIFDKLNDWINTSRRHQAFGLFWCIVQKHPTWLHKVANHSLIRELLKAIRTERNINVTLQGLFCIIVLLPILPSMMSVHLNDVFDILMFLSTWKATNTPELRTDEQNYLQIGIKALFERLYGMYPVNLVTFLRENIKEHNHSYVRVIEPLFRNVKMHPMLLTSDPHLEKHSSRWKEMEPHDVVYECEKLTFDTVVQSNECDSHDRNHISIAESLESTFAPLYHTVDAGQDKQQRAWTGPKWDTIWSPSSVVMATPPPTQSTHTPNPNNYTYGSSGASPPEAAIEATPETTPLRDYARPQRPYPINSSAVRTIWNNSSQPSSPMKRDDNSRDTFNNLASEKLMRMINDRNEVKEITAKTERGASKEDEEVTEIIKSKTSNDEHSTLGKNPRSRSNLLRFHEMTSVNDSFGGSIDLVNDFQTVLKSQRQPVHSITAAKSRTDNATNIHQITEHKACTVETQTDTTLPLTPHSLLDTYIETSMRKPANKIETELKLLCLQLQYERYRREVYAERNRRLLGKSRDSETRKIDNEKLKFQVEQLTEDYKMLTDNMNSLKKTQNQQEAKLIGERNGLRDEAQVQHDINKKLQTNVESLDRRLAEETENKRKYVALLETAQAEIFDLKNLLRQYQYQAEVGNKYKEELQRLQSREVLMGEMKIKCGDKLIELANYKARESELKNIKNMCQDEVKDLRAELTNKSAQLDTAKERIQILEAQLQRQKNVVTEQKSCVKTIKEEYEEKLRAVEAKYSAVKAIILRMEESILDPSRFRSNIGSDVDKSDPTASVDHASPLSMSLASSEGMSSSLKSVTELKNLSRLIDSSSTTVFSPPINVEPSTSTAPNNQSDANAHHSLYYQP